LSPKIIPWQLRRAHKSNALALDVKVKPTQLATVARHWSGPISDDSSDV
jgi:hypothetical protein